MKACQLTVVPSLEEPLGLVAIESMMAETPVIASRTGGLTEIIEHEKTGLLVPRRDHRALGDAVLRLASDARLREQLVQAGRAFVKQRFAPDVLVNQIESIYRQIADRKAA
jgi:glycogen(starch) synthase